MVAGSWCGACVSGAGGEELGDAAAETARGTGLGSAAGETHRGTVWEIVTEETKGDYRFFKVAVEVP